MLRRESNKDWMKGQIASSLPGRLRLRVDGLAFLFDARMDVAGALATIAGVRRVQVTPCTGSVLLEYRGAGGMRGYGAGTLCDARPACTPRKRQGRNG